LSAAVPAQGGYYPSQEVRTADRSRSTRSVTDQHIYSSRPGGQTPAFAWLRCPDPRRPPV